MILRHADDRPHQPDCKRQQGYSECRDPNSQRPLLIGTHFSAPSAGGSSRQVSVKNRAARGNYGLPWRQSRARSRKRHVAEMQQSDGTPDRGEEEPGEVADAVIRYLRERVGLRPKDIFADGALHPSRGGTALRPDRSHVRRAHKGAIIGAADTDALLTLVSDRQQRDAFRVRFEAARVNYFRKRRAFPHLATVRDVTSLRKTLPELWRHAAVELVKPLNCHPGETNWLITPELRGKLVTEVRLTSGVNAALRNALILKNCALTSQHVRRGGNRKDRLSLLDILAATIDLAAQINDAPLLNRLGQELRQISLDADFGWTRLDRILLNRMLADCRARVIRYRGGYNPDHHGRMLWQSVDAALADLEQGLSDDEVAFCWPGLFRGWMAAAFNVVNAGLTTARTRADALLLVERHDRLADAIARRYPSLATYQPIRTRLWSGSDDDPYLAELLTQIALVDSGAGRFNSGRRFAGNGDPDEALHYIDRVRGIVSAPHHRDDTVRFYLVTAEMEAYLQKYAWDWKSHLEDYRTLRGEADALLTAIGPEQPGLRRVLSAMARLERVAGVPPEALAV